MSSSFEQAGAYHGLTKQAALPALVPIGMAAARILPAALNWGSKALGFARAAAPAIKSTATAAGQAIGRNAGSWGSKAMNALSAVGTGAYAYGLLAGGGGAPSTAGAPNLGGGMGGHGGGAATVPGGNMSAPTPHNNFEFNTPPHPSVPHAPLPHIH